MLFKFTHIFILNNCLDYKYSWSKTYLIKYKKSETNFNYFTKTTLKINKVFKNNKSYFSEKDNIVLLKKKTSLIKKFFDMDYTVLNRINKYKNNFDNFNRSFYDKDLTKFFSKKKFFIKTVDFKKKAKMFYNINRKIAKKLFLIKKIKQHAISKELKYICNLKKFDSLMKLENSISNLIMQSDFFFSYKDFVWFLKNGFIFLNSVNVQLENILVKPGDIIQIVGSNNYYNYYKFFLSQLLSGTFIISRKLWSINKNRYLTSYYKGEKTLKFNENFPKKLENYKFYKRDVPIFLEVDYISMTIILLYYNKKINFFSYYNLKFFNFFLNRLYNWRFIV